MRFIKLAFISFLFFFLLLTAISLFIPSRIRISKATNLFASPQKTLQFIRDTSTWKSWHPIFQSGTKQSIRSAFGIERDTDTDSLLTFRIQTGRGQTVLNGFQVYQFPSTDSLTIQWFMDFKLKWYPWEKFGSLFYEGTHGRYMQHGLEQLKKSLEGTTTH